MAAVYKTQCPHCQAQFRISDQHLQQASGAVRCGSCLKVFQANEHLIDAPAPSAGPSRWSLGELPAAPEPAARKWALDDAPEQAAEHDSEDEDEDEDEDDSANPLTPSRNDTSVGLGSLELSDSFLSLDEDDPEGSLGQESFSDLRGAGRKNLSEESDESWAEKLLEELEEKPAPVPASADKMSLEPTEKTAAAAATAPQKKSRAAPPAPKDTDPLDWATDTGGFFDDADVTELGSISLPPAAEPRITSRLALPMDGLSASSSDMLKWGSLSVLLMALLAIQYLAFNFQELARQPTWRPLYTNLCTLVGCQLPDAIDLARIRGSNLVIRAHPSLADALVVDVLIYNESRHPQPFPALELGFTDLQGKAVASRLFKPREYLSASVANQPMPVGTPIRVTFEIADPGHNAHSYSLRFFPADS